MPDFPRTRRASEEWRLRNRGCSTPGGFAVLFHRSEIAARDRPEQPLESGIRRRVFRAMALPKPTQVLSVWTSAGVSERTGLHGGIRMDGSWLVIRRRNSFFSDADLRTTGIADSRRSNRSPFICCAGPWQK